MLFEIANVGVDGVNIHTYPGAPYDLFTFAHANGRWQATVQPEYYGMLMFAQATPPGSRLLRVSTPTTPGIKTWEIDSRDGTIRLVFINDANRRRRLAVKAHANGSATLEQLRAPGIAAERGVTLGGQSFGTQTTTGLLAGSQRLTSLPPSHGTYLIGLPAFSAAMLTIR